MPVVIQSQLFVSKYIFQQLDIKFQSSFPIFSPVRRHEYTCLPAPLQVFVFQLNMPQGSVPKSGLKLLQMFSNHRLQCQHKPTSAFVYCIYRFDVTQMNRCKSQPLWAPWELTNRKLFVPLMRKHSLNQAFVCLMGFQAAVCTKCMLGFAPPQRLKQTLN